MPRAQFIGFLAQGGAISGDGAAMALRDTSGEASALPAQALNSVRLVVFDIKEPIGFVIWLSLCVECTEMQR